jgi:MFS family permease
MLIVALLVIGFSNGAVWCLTPTMISELYGLQYFERECDCLDDIKTKK